MATGTPVDLQALFASIKPRQPSSQPGTSASHYPQQPQRGPAHVAPGYQHPSVSSPIYSPQAVGTPPHHASDVVSPNVDTPRSGHARTSSLNAEQTSNLLNLLKFSQPSQSPPTQQVSQEKTEPSSGGKENTPPGGQATHSRGISASDLVASLKKPSGTASAASGASGRESPAVSSSADAQEMLLNLMKRPKPQAPGPEESGKATERKSKSPDVPAAVQTSVTRQEGESASTADPSRISIRTFGSQESREPTPFEAPQQQAAKETIFTYVNPFDQLADASPRNQTPQGSKQPSGQIAADMKATNGEKPAAKPSSDVKVPPASKRQGEVEIKKETVPEALEGVASQVNKEVEDALARAAADGDSVNVKQESENEDTKELLKSVAKEAHEVEVATTGAEKGAEGDVSAAPAKKDAVEPTNGNGVEDTWETEVDRVIPVYNFPMKPFVSITWKGTVDPPLSFRDDSIMDIARLKKEFDQLDRSLTSATSEYIAYALVKNGGMRIIRQDDGRDKQVFRSTRDRIFHVSLCSTAANSAPTKEQAVLGIGISGTVYWATISKPNKDFFENDSLDSGSLIFPPFPASDENTSGGQLKTRAKRSSRHPEFFAIGRGKSIHIVWPQSAMSPLYGVTGAQRKVDTEKFFKECSLKIATGKAGKDFVFSEDDTVIVLLDKTGRIRFWDIRDIEQGPPGSPPGAIRQPVLTLTTGSPSEKSWPTSVLFIDKLRPYTKGSALRYVLVGLKQNHTIQLWDIGLGKAVQELNFPHGNESDAICSVAYHPSSGIIVVGHPTRNSIYFVHLSAPRYNLPAMSQSSYIQQVAEKDDRLPKPESTACMSGIRELSFGNKGQLRSLELLPVTKPANRGIDDQACLFELYVMHSRGVTCLNITKADLGWSVDNKILQPVNALEEGLIKVNNLQSFPTSVDEQSSSNGAEKEAPKKALESTTGAESSRTSSPAKPSPKKKQIGESLPALDEQSQVTVTSEKKKKKKAAVDNNTNVSSVKVATAKDTVDQQEQQVSASQPTAIMDSNHITGHGGPSGEAINLGISADFLNKEVKKIEKSVSAEFSKAFNKELDALYRRFDEDKRALDAAATARQEAVLRSISSSLSDNVEKSLARIIAGNIQSTVVPALVNTTTASMERQVQEGLGKHLSAAIPQAIKKDLPDAIARAMQTPGMTNSIAELVASKMSTRVQQDVSQVLRSVILPTFEKEHARLAEKMNIEIEQRFVSKLRQYELQQRNDIAKIDELTTLVRGLSETVSAMAAGQARFQGEVAELTRQLSNRGPSVGEPSRAVPEHAESRTPSAKATPSAEQMELAEIAQLMSQERYEEAFVKWVQSEQQGELFSDLFVNFGPSYLTNIAPIVILSVSAAVTSSFENNVQERLNWLQHVFSIIDVMHPDIVAVVPKIMDVLLQRLDALYMSTVQANPHDPVLRRIPPLTRRARELRELRV